MQSQQEIDYGRRTISIDFQTYKKLAELTGLKKIVGYRSSQVGELSIAIDRYYEEEMKTLKPKVKPSLKATTGGAQMFELAAVRRNPEPAPIPTDEVTPQQMRDLALSLLNAADSYEEKQTMAVSK